jgi:hypothetical protein
MNNAKRTSTTPVELDEPSVSLRDVAAYLQGIADATTALSHPPNSAVVQVAVVESATSSIEMALAATHLPSRRTLPYLGRDGDDLGPDTIRVHQMADDPCRDGGELGERGIYDSPTEPFVDERPSDVRLRVGHLSPEWYELVGIGKG